MTALRDASFLWAMIHIVVLFLILFEPQYSWRVTISAGFAGMAALCAVNVPILVYAGQGGVMRAAFFTCTLPSMLLFLALSKYRDGRFFFLFCLTDTTCFWLLQITNFLDRLAGDGYVVLAIGRFIAFPAAEYFFWRYLRRPYLELQRKLEKGWSMFAVIGGIYYLLIMCTAVPVGKPMPDTEGLMRIILVLLLMPATYLTILRSLWRQMQIYESSRQMELQRRDYAAVCQKVALGRIYRHDMRHHLVVLEGLLRQGDVSRAEQYVQVLGGKLDVLTRTVWCGNTAVNAVLSAYITQAEECGCRTETHVRIPSELTWGEMDLCTILGNTLENAVHACRELAEEARWIRLNVEQTENRRLTVLVENACPEPVQFDAGGLPAAPEREGHGLGLRSVQAAVEKYGGIFRCQWEAGSFCVQAVLFPAEGQ